jgi:hypothetical protein
VREIETERQRIERERGREGKKGRRENEGLPFSSSDVRN